MQTTNEEVTEFWKQHGVEKHFENNDYDLSFEIDEDAEVVR